MTMVDYALTNYTWNVASVRCVIAKLILGGEYIGYRMTAKGDISKTLHFLYGQVDVDFKSYGRAIDRHDDELL